MGMHVTWAIAALLASCVYAQKPDVILYGESLCPDTLAALNNHILPLFEGGLADKFTFSYVAYGNAKSTPAGDVVCQHGPPECRLNRVLNCAAELASGQSRFLPFLRCLSAKKIAAMELSVGDCAEEAGLSLQGIENCASGEEGLALEQQAAAATRALHPPHTFVPWVLVNGVPLGLDNGNLYKYICVALPQNQQPEECFAPPDPKALSRQAMVGDARRLGHSKAAQDIPELL